MSAACCASFRLVRGIPYSICCIQGVPYYRCMPFDPENVMVLVYNQSVNVGIVSIVMAVILVPLLGISLSGGADEMPKNAESSHFII